MPGITIFHTINRYIYRGRTGTYFVVIVVEPIVEKVIPEEKIVQETIPLKEIEIPHKTILADKSSISLNDILEKKNLSDFRKAFSLNDRFRFRRELFGGNEEKMNKAISDLNDLSSYEESVTYLNKVLNWNIEDASVADFIKLSPYQGGREYSIVSDAGTPAISDPGFMLVRECVRQGVEVECLPGATAFVPALVASGLPNEKFCFEGFLPQKKEGRPG